MSIFESTKDVVFIGMETSGRVREAMRLRGRYVVSCDLLPADDGDVFSFERGGHIQGDVFETLEWLKTQGLWPTLAIFHPECTYHTLSAAWAFRDPDFDKYPGVGYHQKIQPGTLVGAARRSAREAAEADVERIKRLPIRRKIIENPKGTIPTRTTLGPPGQIIQPYEFGDDASKATCLWYFDEHGLPALDMRLPVDPARRVPGRWVLDNGRMVERWSNQTDKGQNRLSPAEDRWKTRSATYPGIAGAFAQTWAGSSVGKVMSILSIFESIFLSTFLSKEANESSTSKQRSEAAMIKIEITADSAAEFSNHITELAALMGSASPLPYQAALGEAKVAEPKPTSRRKKAEEPKPAEQTTQVAEEVVNGDEPATETAVETVDEQPAEIAAEAVAEAPADEVAGEAVSENLEAFKKMDTAAARAWIIGNYLNACFSDPTVRTEKFREIVKHFDYASLTAVPAEKLPEVLLFVEAKIKEAGK